MQEQDEIYYLGFKITSKIKNLLDCMTDTATYSKTFLKKVIVQVIKCKKQCKFYFAILNKNNLNKFINSFGFGFAGNQGHRFRFRPI